MSNTKESWMTEKVMGMIGKEAPPLVSPDEVNKSDIRRFVQAVMDDNPIFYDDARASQTKYREIVAPGSYPVTFVGKRPLGTPDPMTQQETGVGQAARELQGPLPDDARLFHGSSDLEIRRLPKLGDRITMRERLTDIYEKTGRSGRLAFIVTEKTFTNQDDEILCIERYAGVAILG